MMIAVAVENADACEAIVTTLDDLSLVVKVCSSVAELRALTPDVAFCEWPLRGLTSHLIEYLQENALSRKAVRIEIGRASCRERV